MRHAFLNDCKKNNIQIQYNIPLAPLSAFQSGGHAELFFAPQSYEELQYILQSAHAHHIPLTILGGGSNVLAPDGILPGLTISTLALSHIEIHEDQVHISCGISVRTAATILANNNLRALDFLYGMPGSIGGALWMNARCYGKEISEVLISATGYSLQGIPWAYTYTHHDFSYKQSPFQHMGVITECSIRITKDDATEIWRDMISHEMDRTNKGHYIAPCAGSVFKNNYDFGAPSGQLLEQLGWKNKTYNNAKVNPHHANIIINDGGASSTDIYILSQHMQESVLNTHHMQLEREIVLLGDQSLWKY